MKTLRAVVAWIEANVAAAPGTVANGAAGNGQRPVVRGGAKAPGAAGSAAILTVPELALRFVPRLEELPAADASPARLAGLRVAVTDDGQGIAPALVERLVENQADARVLAPEQAPGEVDALVDLGGLARQPTPVTGLFELVRSAATGGAQFILAVTGDGGSFGHVPRGQDETRVANLPGGTCLRHGAVRGLLKTVAREYPQLCVLAIDVDPAEPAECLADQLLFELVRGNGRVEIGCARGRRHGLRLVEEALDVSGGGSGLDLDAESVLVITGGARGIGARAAIAFAREFGCRIELIGRSPLPEPTEPAEYAAAADAVSLRRVLAGEGRLTDPAAIEGECARLLAAREIRATLLALAETGVPAAYHRVDVRDGDAFARTIEKIYERHGRIDGVIHAAGILEDRLIRDKTAESFERVFATKVASAQTLARVLRPDVRFVACFGSVAGVFGNRGQADYAAANAALGAFARDLDARIAGRAVCVHWGPWAGTGMVSPALAREYARRGIGLIDPDDGVRCLLDELRYGDAAEVVIMRARPERFVMPRDASRTGDATTHAREEEAHAD